MANTVQIRLIHIARAQLALKEEFYRQFLRERFNVACSKDLTYAQAHELIETFKRMGFRIRPKKPQCKVMCEPQPKGLPLPDNTLLLVSPQQLLRIDRLRADIRWRHWDGYNRWLKKYFGIDRVRTSIEASMVIEALKNMWRGQNCTCSLARKT